MLKRPQARDVMADIFPHDTNNWSEALKHWTPALPSIKNARALVLGRNAPGLALWLALQGYEVYVYFNPDDFEIFKVHQVDAQIHELNTAAQPESFDIVCDVLIKETMDRISADLNEAHQCLKSSGLLLLGMAGPNARKNAFSKLGTEKKFKEVQIKRYGLIPSSSKIKYIRHLVVLLNKLLQPITPNSWKYLLYLKASK